MSIKLMTEAWNTDAKGNDLLVLLSLCDFANDEGELFPSIATISKKAKVAKSTLSYILKAYEQVGVLERNRRKRDNGSDTSTHYKILTLNFDYTLFKKYYQEARNYKAKEKNSSQCEHLGESKHLKNVNTQNHNVNTQNANCEHLEPSYYTNRQDINHHKKNTKKKIFEFLRLIKIEFAVVGAKGFVNNLEDVEIYLEKLESREKLLEIINAYKKYYNDNSSNKFVKHFNKFLAEAVAYTERGETLDKLVDDLGEQLTEKKSAFVGIAEKEYVREEEW